MSGIISQSALCRLLVLNNKAYDLDIQLRNIHLPAGLGDQRESAVFTPGPIADLQDDIDRTVRAGLVTLWLADSVEPE